MNLYTTLCILRLPNKFTDPLNKSLSYDCQGQGAFGITTFQGNWKMYYFTQLFDFKLIMTVFVILPITTKFLSLTNYFAFEF